MPLRHRLATVLTRLAAALDPPPRPPVARDPAEGAVRELERRARSAQLALRLAEESLARVRRARAVLRDADGRDRWRRPNPQRVPRASSAR